MAGYETSDRYGLPLGTAATMAITGATTLVAAPAAGSAIAVDAITVTYTTDTTGRMDVYARQSDAAAATGMFRTFSNMTLSAANNSVGLNAELAIPWMLDTATSLQFVLSVSAASTPGVSISVRYRIFTR